MLKIYCGSKKLPANHRVGTMQECVDKNQVRLYGINKVDTRLLEGVAKAKVDTKAENKVISKYTALLKRIEVVAEKIKHAQKRNKLELIPDLKKEGMKVIKASQALKERYQQIMASRR